ncbi:MAG: preprotein translocase subunit SecE [Candidatus Taylorbacteria bacterium RIFCSPLOWO2_01_FULL_45_15b]|uniref:Protein translocase subunit SecE n=1 Tax=Candidatus Taylorbacteria bacterium RIFCSPLOWO2_01_FULL_45_15b TaxID=1802319 RepID=A0A1G2ND45_9BACT|nr:MAG: preprotein translocase subunit SecE [Candidatus Taylorbacteria bacterium RIFCSPLOWO2_01_FULL_45_15b]
MGLSQYLSETKGEIKHVSWPTRKQSIAYTAVVIIISIAVGVFLGLFDVLFAYILKLFI